MGERCKQTRSETELSNDGGSQRWSVTCKYKREYKEKGNPLSDFTCHPPQPRRNTKKGATLSNRSLKWRLPTLPHFTAVPSALMGLTSLFGMGRGGTPLL